MKNESKTSAILGIALGFIFVAPSLRAADRPNVVLIVCDDLNDYVEGLGGHPQVKTPNMKRLMDQGISFTEAHCNIPICSPSRASFVTGIYPHNSQFFGFDDWRENEVLRNSRTMMEHFSANGYQTFGTGKIMHNFDQEEWMEFGNKADYGPFASDGKSPVAHPDTPSPFRDDFGKTDGSFGPFESLKGRVSPKTGKPFRWVNGNWRSPVVYKVDSESDRDLTPDEENARWAADKIRSLTGSDKPFFMGVGFIRPHTPLIVPKKYFDRFPLESIQLPVIKDGDADDTFKHTVNWDPEDRNSDRGTKIHDSLVASYGGDRELALRKFIQAYLAAVAAVDDCVGEVLDALESSPFKDNTIVILTSDHGWGMGQKEYLYKNSLWQESTRVPLVVSVPGHAKGGSRTSQPVSLIDLYPTLIELCSLSGVTVKNEKGHALDGFSFGQLLADPKEGKWNGPEAVLTALFKGKRYYDPAEQSYTLRDREWRYIRYENGKEELYHVAEDPHEWTNLALNPEHEEMLVAYRKQLLSRIPKSKPQSEEEKKAAAEKWKDDYFKKNPKADLNKDGELTWPELQKHKKGK